MNERIKELAKLATQQYSPTYYTQEWIQGFAELLVRECIYIVENTSDRYRKEYFANKIKQHFGVEE